MDEEVQEEEQTTLSGAPRLSKLKKTKKITEDGEEVIEERDEEEDEEEPSGEDPDG